MDVKEAFSYNSCTKTSRTIKSNLKYNVINDAKESKLETRGL